MLFLIGFISLYPTVPPTVKNKAVNKLLACKILVIYIYNFVIIVSPLVSQFHTAAVRKITAYGFGN